MNLRKDAWIAVSLAGAVLVTAGISTRMAKGPSAQLSPSTAEAMVSDPEVYDVFRQASRAKDQTVPVARASILAPFRAKMAGIYNSRKMRSPVDLFRIASVLGSSTDPKELAVAHKLSVEALAGGVQEARQVVFETQDRLLLSLGEKQRYGTQEQWQGQDLSLTRNVSTEVPTAVRNRLGLVPRSRAVPVTD